jgi:hypothetical protein
MRHFSIMMALVGLLWSPALKADTTDLCDNKLEKALVVAKAAGRFSASITVEEYLARRAADPATLYRDIGFGGQSGNNPCVITWETTVSPNSFHLWLSSAEFVTGCERIVCDEAKPVVGSGLSGFTATTIADCDPTTALECPPRSSSPECKTDADCGIKTTEECKVGRCVEGVCEVFTDTESENCKKIECTPVYNATQSQEADFDNDGFADACDICPTNPAFTDSCPQFDDSGACLCIDIDLCAAKDFRDLPDTISVTEYFRATSGEYRNDKGDVFKTTLDSKGNLTIQGTCSTLKAGGFMSGSGCSLAVPIK